jgi:hypothetical protein
MLAADFADWEDDFGDDVEMDEDDDFNYEEFDFDEE